MAQVISGDELRKKVAEYGLAKPGSFHQEEVREGVSDKDILATYDIEDEAEAREARRALTAGAGKLRPKVVWYDKETGAKIVAEPTGNDSYTITHDERGGPGKANTLKTTVKKPGVTIVTEQRPGEEPVLTERTIDQTGTAAKGPPGGEYVKVQNTPEGPYWHEWDDVGGYLPIAGGKAKPEEKVLDTDHSRKSGITSILVGASKEDAHWVEIKGGPRDPAEPPKKILVEGGDGKKYNHWYDANGVEHTELSSLPGETPKAERLQDPETKEWLERGPDNKWRPIERADSGTPGAGSRPFPKGTMLGSLSEVLIDYSNELWEKVRNKEMTEAQAEKEMTRFSGIADVIYQEQSKIGDIQKSTYDTDVRQRGDTLQDTQSRRTFSTNAMTQALDFNKQTAPYLPEGSRENAGKAFMGQLLLSNIMAGMIGGLKNTPEVKKPAALEQLMGAGLGGAMPQPPATINIVNGVPSAPSQPNFMAPAISGDIPGGMPRLPGGGFAPPGMNLTDQLRAPGYQAPDEEDPLQSRGGGFPWV
jgi:hypothetical protein